MARFVPGSATTPTAEVELSLSCRNLLDCDVFSKSDPMCVTYLKTYSTQDWIEVGRTETIDNTLNPDFAQKVNLTYRFEEQQWLKFSVYDIDTQSHSLQEQDFLGTCECTLGQVVSAGKLVLALHREPYNQGELIVSVEELGSCRDEVTLQFSGRTLDRKDWFGSSDPFLELQKVGEDGSYHVVHRTEVIKWTLNPNWKPFTIPIRNLCGADLHRSIKIVCYDWNRSGNHSLIGEFCVTLNELSAGPGASNIFYCIHPRKRAKSQSYRHSGEVILVRYEYRKVFSFLDYVKDGGTQLNCTIAIDFTASNGDPQHPESLHFVSQAVPNQYEQALSAVGEIIQDYDSDKLFPVLGFGARLPPDGRISHEFYVNMLSNPYCSGMAGVLEAYKSCIRQIQLYGPTNFSPVINHVAKFAETYRDGSQYFILLIVTDGVITDMMQTKKAIIHASALPMSIIIVGVGQADFSAMNELDADTIPLVHDGIKAERDIVQFVPFRDFQNIRNSALAKAYLAKEVLAEIPDQIIGYMKSRNIVPKSRSDALTTDVASGHLSQC